MQLRDLMKRIRSNFISTKQDKRFVDIGNNFTGIEDCMVEPYLSQFIDINKYIATDISAYFPSCKKPYYCPLSFGGTTTFEIFEYLYDALSTKYWIVGQDFQTLEGLGGIRTGSDVTTFPGAANYNGSAHDYTFKEIAGSCVDKMKHMWYFPLTELYHITGPILNIANKKIAGDFKSSGKLGHRLVWLFIEDPDPCRKTLYEEVFKYLVIMPDEIKETINDTSTDLISIGYS